MANTHQVRECRIQTCPTWAPSDESWTYQSDWFVSAPISTACGGNGGSASFTAIYGRKHDPRRVSIYSQYPLQSFVGEWCRDIVADPDGDISVGADTFTAIWYGKISTWEIQPTAANRPNVTVEIGAEHVTAAFLAVACCHSWETPSDNSVDIVPTYIPPVFNAIPYGDKSNLVWDLDGVSVPIFNRSTQLKEDRNLWTYGNALKYLCASARPWIPTQERGGQNSSLTLVTLPNSIRHRCRRSLGAGIASSTSSGQSSIQASGLWSISNLTSTAFMLS